MHFAPSLEVFYEPRKPRYCTSCSHHVLRIKVLVRLGLSGLFPSAEHGTLCVCRTVSLRILSLNSWSRGTQIGTVSNEATSEMGYPAWPAGCTCFYSIGRFLYLAHKQEAGFVGRIVCRFPFLFYPSGAICQSPSLEQEPSFPFVYPPKNRRLYFLFNYLLRAIHLSRSLMELTLPPPTRQSRPALSSCLVIRETPVEGYCSKGLMHRQVNTETLCSFS